ncbi:hybrid sensor histidine kinase/response regulator [Nostoc sp. 'Peltigera membranacea cyanobiont' 210A]|uniref:hybrid histidine kinase/response regulator HrmK n=1 Tax=Nostoc sp. 'Peltigera membranacea cyanobiont' 210A TaxID=2014529 RepID=UPI000B953D3E|nr:hybrid histidine kinase/response regulator HrmK [Nostoc sp. 'Peltigera membranacea cyanobiont' 210A]OYD94346.1 hybrid sensor histidine kinase/response regulator [Nostoc sp. 'Peltigera membranacea cyanobiont' 210A]
MQQYSSLPDQNSLIDVTPKLLTTIEQLRAQLWLESSLNQLQSRLNDCLLSACNTVPQPEAAQAEIFQTVVNEINSAVNSSNLALTECAVGIAMCQPQETVATVCYVSRSSSPHSAPLFLEVLTAENKLLLRLQEVIKLEDLQQLENQQLPSAWRLADDSGSVIGWLIIATPPLSSHHESLIESQAQLRSQLMARSAKQCTTALVQLRHILSWPQRCQQLSNSNQELERTNQLKNQFLANTSHEIRTPLSSIIGFTHLLLAPGYEPSKERQQEYLNIIQSSGKHLLALINDILDLSKIEANQLEVQWETVDVQLLCSNVLALVKEKAANKGLRLCLELEPDITTLVADPLRLKQMLLNLLFNALKFTSKGSVGLQIASKGVFVHFTVWDTGTGISQEDQVQLFQPYFQIAKAVADGIEGTGLGLAVTQKLAQIHGGSVKVESEIDRGSRFTLVLPLKQELGVGGDEGGEEDEEAGEAEFSSFPLPLTPSYSVEVLLVENDLPNANLMQIYLRNLGYQVTWVKNAAEMWEALTQLDPAVILMDVCLTDGNGLNLVQQLRENQQYRKIPVIVQTAMAMKGDRETCLNAGVNDYISKPIDLPLLASLVAKYSKPAI